MKFEGRVWRFVPAGAYALDFPHLIHAAGRWNRRGIYGCLYTALSPEAAIAEYRKHVVRRGLGGPGQDLVGLAVEVEPVLNVMDLVGRRPLASRMIRVLRPFLGTTGDRLYLRLPPIVVAARLLGDGPADLDHCRDIADWARSNGYLAIRTPSAAREAGEVLAIYPENRPADLVLTEVERFPLNYGPKPLVDAAGNLIQPVPATSH